MDNRFEQIMAFFELSPEEKNKNIARILKESVDYFQTLQSVIQTGSLDEKRKAIDEFLILQKRIAEETSRLCEKLNMTPEELKKYGSDPRNFSKVEWDTLLEAKEQLSKPRPSLEHTAHHPEEKKKRSVSRLKHMRDHWKKS